MWNCNRLAVRLSTAFDSDWCPSPFAVSAPAEAVEVIAFLASRQAADVNGQIVGIDGGMTIS